MEVELRESQDSHAGHQVLSGLRALQLSLRCEPLPDFSLAGPEAFEARGKIFTRGPLRTISGAANGSMVFFWRRKSF